MGRRGIETPSVQDNFFDQKAAYEAARTNRLRRRRTGFLLTGSGADYHYRNVFDYLRIIEYARDMARNDAIVGQMVDRAVLNTIQGGLTPDPKTEDHQVNVELLARFNAWANDAQACDVSGTKTFTDLEEIILRSTFIDGDIAVLPTDSGGLQLAEAHRMRTPTGTKRNVICGVLIDDLRKPVEYWITKDDVDPWVPVTLVGGVDKVPAFDEEGHPNVFHIYDPKRYTQTRGISALAPIFDLCGMHEDLQFAKLVQQQVTSCFAIIRERASDFTDPGKIGGTGPQTQETWNAFTRLVQELAPGMELRGLPGEKITMPSPNVPNAEFFQQMRMILQLIGLNLGLPLVLLLMDASDTNFSGWRGAVDQARMGFRRNQRWLIDHFHTPVYLWKLRQFIREDRALRAAAARMGPNFFNHLWNAPRWPYIQPLQDAQADQLRQRALLTSPRRIQSERNQDWSDIISETVKDNGDAILKSIERAAEITKAGSTPVTWREVLFLTDPEMYKAAATSAQAAASAAGGGNKAELLNGLQITAAIDIFNKVRDKALVSTAAIELLVGVGMNRATAETAVKETVNGSHLSTDTVAFQRTVLTALLNDPTTRAIVANATPIAGPDGLVGQTGLPVQTNFVEGWVQAPPGSLVGGDTPPELPAPPDPNKPTTDSPPAPPADGKTPTPPAQPAGEPAPPGAGGAEAKPEPEPETKKEAT